jgi:hypothetical protein
MKKAVFCDVTPCGSCNNRRFRERSVSFIRVTIIGELGTTLLATDASCEEILVRRLLVIANGFPSSPIITLMMEAARSFKTSVHTRAPRSNIPSSS